MKIRTTKNHYVADCRPHGKEKRFPKTPDGRRAAKALISNIQKSFLTSGVYSDPTTTPFYKDAVEDFFRAELARVKRNEVELDTVQEKYRVLKEIGEFQLVLSAAAGSGGRVANSFRVGEITTAYVINDIIAELYGNQSWGTGKRKISHLSCLYTWLNKCEITPHNPTVVDKPKQPIEEAKPIDRIAKDDIKKIIECASLSIRLKIKFAAETGLRAGEMIALTWDDIDFDDGYLTVDKALKRNRRLGPPKTKASYRTNKINPSLLGLLREWKFAQPISQRGKNLVFPTRTGHYSWSNVWRTQGLHPACDKAGVERIRWHDLRHYYASILLYSAREDTAVICKLMGHSDISTTHKKYGHWLKDDARDKEIGERHAAAFA